MNVPTILAVWHFLLSPSAADIIHYILTSFNTLLWHFVNICISESINTANLNQCLERFYKHMCKHFTYTHDASNIWKRTVRVHVESPKCFPKYDVDKFYNQLNANKSMWFKKKFHDINQCKMKLFYSILNHRTHARWSCKFNRTKNRSKNWPFESIKYIGI